VSTLPVFNVRSPSPEVREKGWIYTLLDPGSYYLQFIPPGSQQNPLGKAQPGPPFWFEVPEGSLFTYIGTFSISCTSRWGIFSRLIDQCSAVQVSDESESARSVGQSFFETYAPMSTKLAQKYGEPIFPNSLEKYLPMGVSSNSREIFVSPGWRKRALSRFTGIGDWITPETARLAGGGYPPGAIGAAYVIFYLPPAIIVGAIAGEMADSKWKSCSKGLIKALREFNLKNELRTAITDALKKYTSSPIVDLMDTQDAAMKSSEQELRSILQADIVRVAFRECNERGLFCAEMAFRVRLIDQASKILLSDRVLLYSGHCAVERPYELSLKGSSRCRKLDEYCGEEGAKLFIKELLPGFTALKEKIAEDLSPHISRIDAKGRPSRLAAKNWFLPFFFSLMVL